MKQYHKYVGLDVHKERNEIPLAEGGGSKLFKLIAEPTKPMA